LSEYESQNYLRGVAVSSGQGGCFCDKSQENENECFCHREGITTSSGSVEGGNFEDGSFEGRSVERVRHRNSIAASGILPSVDDKRTLTKPLYHRDTSKTLKMHYHLPQPISLEALLRRLGSSLDGFG